MNHLQKSNKKLGKMRGLFFQAGLIVASGLTFLAFEWTTPLYIASLPEPDEIYEESDWDVALIIPEEVKQPEVKLEQPKVKIDPLNFTPVVNTKEIPEKGPTEPAVLVFDPNELKVKEKIVEPDIIVDFVEKMPEFIGGDKALFQYLSENVKYPKDAKEIGLSGIVYVEFVVGKTGKMRDIKIKRGVNKYLDEEALRVVKLMPSWIPGKQGGKTVSARFTLPINFVLR